MLYAMMSDAFSAEDKPVIEAAYANIEGADFWDMKPVFLGIDSGGTRARRILQKLIGLEGAEP
jgi:vanillate O-demethylase monooxygenase subunit